MSREVDASIDTLTSIDSEVLQASGPYGRTYDLQQLLDLRREHLANLRSRLYDEYEQHDRADHARGGFGNLTSVHEWVERQPEIQDLTTEIEALSAQVAEAQVEAGGIVFLPAVENLPKIEKKIAALSRKAGQIGSESITLTLTDERLLLHYPYAWDNDRAFSADFEHVFAVLKGATPKIPGYEFLATITPTEAGNVVKRIPAIAYGVRHNLDWGHHEGEEYTSTAAQALESIDLSRFHSTGEVCEHCHKLRRRSDLYVVYNEKTGEALQVGRTCLRSYMGSDDPERVLKNLEQVMEIVRFARQRGEQPSLATTDFMTHAALMVRANAGYVKGLGHEARSNWIRMINREYASDRGRKVQAWVDPIEHDEQEGARILKWVREEWDETGEFATNVKLALSGEAMDPKLVGYAGAAFIAHTKWVEGASKREAAQAQQEANAEKRHIGTVGQREIFTLTVKSIKWIADRYGYSYNNEPATKPMIIMADPEGNEVKWFASDLPRVTDKDEMPPRVGGTYQVKATVKYHDDNDRYGKSTVVTRCKFEKVIYEPEEG